MKAKDALIAWTPNRHALNWAVSEGSKPGVQVGPLLKASDDDWTEGFDMTGGAAWRYRHALKKNEQLAAVLLEFAQLVLVWGLDPLDVHRAFLTIDEYAEAHSRDFEPGRYFAPKTS